jgi:glyoxylase-like metal-dependent hydrolase (beta-lactamase superfamily II)
VERLVLTHAHPDHAGSVPAVASATGAPVWGDSRDLNTAISGVEVVLDRDLRGGDTFEVPGGVLEVIETPGHAPGHISLYSPQQRALYAGDLLSGNGTIAVIPPRGSMFDYVNSLKRVHAYEIDTIYPGHGPVIVNGHRRIGEYITHRETREEAIFAEVARGNEQIGTLVDVLYPDVIPRLRWHAEGTVLAHLLRLAQLGRVQPVNENEAETWAERRFVAS